jgi:hypothetical protein
LTLLLKLVLVPGLIALVTMAGRRFGPRVGGWLNAMPVVAGPVLFFLAVEQGDAFVAGAALATLAGLAAVAVFAVVYSWAALRWPWWGCVLIGWTVFGALTLALQAVAWTAGSGLALALGAFGLAPFALPPMPEAPPPVSAPAWDLPMRMAAAVTLVLTVTGLAAFLPAMWSFALFCAVLAWGVTGLGRDAAFLLALAASLVVQGLVWLGLAARASRGSARPGPRAARRSA